MLDRLLGVDLHDSDRIVVEDGRDVLRGEFIRRITDEKASLANSTITNDDAPGAHR